MYDKPLRLELSCGRLVASETRPLLWIWFGVLTRNLHGCIFGRSSSLGLGTMTVSSQDGHCQDFGCCILYYSLWSLDFSVLSSVTVEARCSGFLTSQVGTKE